MMAKPTWRWAWLAMGFAIVGCAVGEGDDRGAATWNVPWGDGGGTDGSPMPVEESSTSGGGAEGDGDSGDDDDDDDDEPLDVPADPTTGAADDGGTRSGCEKIDLLMAIDGSISMDVAQDKLSTSIESFIDAIETSLVDEVDYHLGVITTTEYTYNADGCSAPGSLISQTGGTGSSNQACGPFADGGAWVSPADGDVAERFRCIAGIGLGNGNVELTAQALTEAVTGDGPGGCNAGFVRDDALLVIVNITDTDDPSSYPPGQGSSGDPAGWYTAIVTAKGGVETNVVMISVLPPTNPSCTVEGNWSPLLPGQLDAPRLDELTTSFTHHYVGDICANDYGVLLDEALAEIAAGCESFNPVE